MRAEDRTIYSVCSISKGKWYWAAWSNYFMCPEPLAEGYATSREEADRLGRDAAGPWCHRANDSWARSYRRELRLKERAKKTSHETGTNVPEFLYRMGEGFSEQDNEYHRFCYAHRIVKKTATRVYVDTEAYQGLDGKPPHAAIGDWYAYDIRTWVLDRAELERERCARPSVWHWWNDGAFYLDQNDPRPFQRTAASNTPPCIALLGLAYPCTMADVKRAYRRKAQKVHPDKGGDHGAFIALQKAYEQALRLAGEPVGVV